MKFIFWLLLALSLFACSDENVINDTSNTWSVLAASNSPDNRLLTIEFPSGKVTNNDVYGSANANKLSSIPRVMSEFGGFIFLVKPADFQIEVIDSKTYVSKYLIDFKSENKKPLSIAFAPNATAAYVIFEQDSTVDIIDLTVMKVARSITLNGIASSIALSGNQVFVTCPEINKLAVIDTRDNKLKDEIDVPEYPVLVALTYDDLNIVVVSAGSGKFDTDSVTTDAYVSLLDINTKAEISHQPLGIGIVNPKEQIPLALATAQRLYAFIGTNEYLLQFNTRTGTVPARLKNGKFVSVLFNERRDEMIFLRDDGGSKTMLTYDAENKKNILEIQLPEGVVNVLPL